MAQKKVIFDSDDVIEAIREKYQFDYQLKGFTGVLPSGIEFELIPDKKETE